MLKQCKNAFLQRSKKQDAINFFCDFVFFIKKNKQTHGAYILLCKIEAQLSCQNEKAAKIHGEHLLLEHFIEHFCISKFARGSHQAMRFVDNCGEAIMAFGNDCQRLL